MKELPQDVGDNPHLAALQNIIYDDDPNIVAESLNVKINLLRNKAMNDCRSIRIILSI